MKIALGTVQFGLNYGINNSLGIPQDNDVKDIFDTAFEAGIKFIDTANSYGNAEERIGRLTNHTFNIITKFPNIDKATMLKQSLSDSLKKLGCSSVYGYLSHNAAAIIKNRDVWSVLQEFKEKGLVNKIGFSLYQPSELQQLLDMNCVPDLVQLPFSILDRKFEIYFNALKNLNTEIHVRSVFLQGLYLMNVEKLPKHLISLKPELLKLNNIAEKYGVEMSRLALNYVAQNPYIDQLVLGVESKKQLEENIFAMEQPNLSGQIIDEINQISVLNHELLNPVNWKK